MAILKKYIVWIILALILLAEGGVTFVLFGRRSEASAAAEKAVGKKRELDSLKIWEQKAPELREKWGKYRDALTVQRNYAVLFFWQRDQRIERLFDHPNLAQYRLKPGDTTVAGFDRFRFVYQNVYNEEAEKLVARASKMYIDRAGLGLASVTAFTQPHITLGDILRAQKEFWVIKAIVDAALAAEVSELDPLQIGGSKVRGRPVAPVPGETEEAKLAKPIKFDVVVRGPYPQVSRFAEELHRSTESDAHMRVSSVLGVKRGETKKSQSMAARAVRLPVGRGAAPGGATAEEMMEGGPPALAPPVRGMPEEMPPPPGMDMPPGMELPPAMAPRPGVVPGVRPAPGIPAAAAESAVPEEPLVESTFSCQVTDFTLDIARATLAGPRVTKKDSAKAWLQARLGGGDQYQTLWSRLLAGLNTAQEQDVKEAGEGIEVTLRPDDQFGGPTYVVSLTLDGTKIELAFRLVTFKAAESEKGVEKAGVSR